MIRDNHADSLADFYSHVLSFESICAGQTQADDWSSSANAVSRPGSFPTAGQPSQQRSFDNNPGHQGNGQGSGGGRPYVPHQQQGQVGNNNRSNDNYGGGDRRQNNGGSNGRNGRNRQRPCCQLCTYWGHEASDCRNRFNPEFQPPR